MNGLTIMIGQLGLVWFTIILGRREELVTEGGRISQLHYKS